MNVASKSAELFFAVNLILLATASMTDASGQAPGVGPKAGHFGRHRGHFGAHGNHFGRHGGHFFHGGRSPHNPPPPPPPPSPPSPPQPPPGAIDVTKSPYLADNTGTRDCTASLNAASTAAGVAGIYLPAGTYKISAPIMIDSKAATGAGSGTVIVASQSTNCAFTLKGTSPSISSMVFTCSSPVQSASPLDSAILVNSATGALVNQVTVQSASAAGIAVLNSNGAGIQNDLVTGTLGPGIELLDGVSNSYATNNSLSAISRAPALMVDARNVSAQNVVFSSNTISASGAGLRGTVYVSGVQGFQFTNNNVSNTQAYGLKVFGTDDSTQGGPVANVTIKANQFTGCGQGAAIWTLLVAGASLSHAVTVNGVNIISNTITSVTPRNAGVIFITPLQAPDVNVANATISSNVINTASGATWTYGIVPRDVRNLTIDGNAVTNVANTIIDYAGACGAVEISHNNLANNLPASTTINASAIVSVLQDPVHGLTTTSCTLIDNTYTGAVYNYSYFLYIFADPNPPNASGNVCNSSPPLPNFLN